jgi:asparagine synthase (glutamine-hydrolysing)
LNDVELLLNKLRNVIHPFKERIAVAFSGGLDSSVIAKIASEETTPMLYTVGLKDCKDFAAAESAAKLLKLPLKTVEITEKDVLEAVPLLAQVIANDNKLIVSYELPLWFVCKNCREKIVLSGQGADELFGGYAKYGKFKGKGLESEMKTDAQDLKENGIALDRAIAAKFGKELVVPFLDNGVFDFAMNLPLEKKINAGENKVLLREVARLLGLEDIAIRKKRAAQYGSGIAKAMRKMK